MDLARRLGGHARRFTGVHFRRVGGLAAATRARWWTLQWSRLGDARIVRSCSIRAPRWSLPISDVDADHSQEHVKEHGEKDRQYDGNQNHCQASPATAERADVDVSQTHDVLSSAVCTDVGDCGGDMKGSSAAA